MEKSVINQICASMDTFFETGTLSCPPFVSYTHLVGELAKECQVSEASVSRFCKKIDMKGFHHLKISISKEMVSQSEDDELSNHISVDDLEQSLKNILANKVAELTQTVSMMNSENLQDILKRINNAQNVLFAAVGNTVPVAMDGAYKLNQIGISAVSTPVWETQLAYSYNLSPDDVVIAISNSGESTGVINILEAAKMCIRDSCIVLSTHHLCHFRPQTYYDFCFQFLPESFSQFSYHI